MTDSQFLENIKSVGRASLEHKNQPVPVRLTGLSPYAVDQLGCFSIFNQSVNQDGLIHFLDHCNLRFIADETACEWILSCLEKSLIQVEYDGDRIFFCPDEDVRMYFEKELPEKTKRQYHQDVDRFYLGWLIDIASELNIQLPADEEAQRSRLIGPNGVLDIFVHAPQEQSIFLSSLKIGLSWQDHLFQLNSFEEASNIVNIICFAVDRQGQHQLAQALLLRLIAVTEGLSNLVLRINLATLLRGGFQIDPALRIYRQTIPGLISERAYSHLVIVFSGMGVIYRQKGQLWRAAILLELCSALHGLMKNYKSQAIARSQVANVYRYLKLFGLALRASKLACSYFRKSNDFLNLGRTLLTQGDILYKLGNANLAMSCFDESLATGRLISDPQAICGALSGKARIHMLTHTLDEVKPLLDEVIGIRQRNSDHTIGVEYQNMGVFYEMSGNLNVALVWYQKALKVFEQYMPVEVAACKRNITNVEKKQAKKKKSSDQI